MKFDPFPTTLPHLCHSLFKLQPGDTTVKVIMGHKQGDITKDIVTNRVKESTLLTINIFLYGQFKKMCPEKFGSLLGATVKK